MIIFTILETVIIVIMFDILLIPRREGKLWHTIYSIGGIIVLSAITLAILDVMFVVKAIITVAVACFFCMIAYKTNWRTSIMLTLLFCYEIIVCDIIMTNIMSIANLTHIIDIVNMNSHTFFILGVLSKFFAFAVTFLTAVRLKRLDFEVPLKYGTIFDIILGLIFLTNMFYTQTDTTVIKIFDSLQIITICVSYMVITLLSFIVFFDLCRYYIRKSELQCEKIKNDFLMQQLNEQKSMEMEMRSIRHDMLNHMSALSYLNKQHDDERFDKYLCEYQLKPSVKLTRCETGIQILDAIIASKRHIINEKNITFKVKDLGIKHTPDVSEYKLSSIFANLLDNAISAASNPQIEDKTITIAISEKGGFTFFRITNNYCDNSDVNTVETNGHIHQGLGLKIIESTISETYGAFEHRAENGIFTATVMLPASENAVIH